MTTYLLIIEAIREGNRLKIGIHMQRETAWTYHQLTTPIEDIKQKAVKFLKFITLKDIYNNFSILNDWSSHL